MVDPREQLWDLVDDDDALNSQLDKDEWLQAKHVNFEELCVKRVLNKLNLAHLTTAIKSTNAERSGERTLTLSGFIQCQPNFPVYLGARDVYKAHEVTTQDLATKFTNTTIFKAYTEIVDEAAGFGYDTAVGLIYRPGGIYTVLHNRLSSLDNAGFYQVRTLKKGQIFIIEKLDQFLENLEWHPDPETT